MLRLFGVIITMNIRPSVSTCPYRIPCTMAGHIAAPASILCTVLIIYTREHFMSSYSAHPLIQTVKWQIHWFYSSINILYLKFNNPFFLFFFLFCVYSVTGELEWHRVCVRRIRCDTKMLQTLMPILAKCIFLFFRNRKQLDNEWKNWFWEREGQS